MSDCEICRDEQGVDCARATTWRYIDDLDTEIAVCALCARIIDDNADDKARARRIDAEQDAQDHAEGMAESRAERQMERSLDAAQNAFLDNVYGRHS